MHPAYFQTDSMLTRLYDEQQTRLVNYFYAMRQYHSLRGAGQAEDPTAALFQHGLYYQNPIMKGYRPFIQEEPKPNQSYIGLIAMAILSSGDQKMILSDIYQWILDHYSYFRTRGPGWRNSIRHNLSLNDCFIKAGRSANGKGHYWAIHPANLEDFKKGDFRRRRAQRRVRKHMGLSVPDDDEDDDSLPPSSPVLSEEQCSPVKEYSMAQESSVGTPRKRRGFDILSLLSDDDDDEVSGGKVAKVESDVQESELV